MKKLLPILLALMGVTVGIGAGVFLRPNPEATTAIEPQTHQEEKEDHSNEADPNLEYVKLNNQFVVPVIENDKVTSMVLVSLSLEVSAGFKEMVFLKEPRLRDALLQVMFDHANMGGFDGAFTRSGNLDLLRNSLLEAARLDLGEILSEVLIIDIARQEF